MLANPILLPAYADPINWGMALVAMLAEISAARAMMRRFGFVDPRLATWLFAVNLATWVPFLVAVERLRLSYSAESIPAFALLEIAVMMVETVLIRLLASGLSARVGSGALSLRRSLAVSVVGNSVSIAVSLTLPAVFIALLSQGG